MKRLWLKDLKCICALVLLCMMFLVSGCDNEKNNGNNSKQDISADKETIENDTDEEGMVLNIREAKEGELSSDLVMRIGNTSLTYKEAMLYMLSQREEAEIFYGKEIWNYKLDTEGTTYEKLLKERTLNDLIYLKLVCSQANKLNVYLTEDEKMDVDEYTLDYIMNFSDSMLKEYGIDNITVNKIYTDNVLANKIYESLTLNVDTTVPDEEAMQSVFYYILLPKYSYNQNGELIKFTTDELNDMKKYAQKVYDRALAGEDFYTLAKLSSYDSDEIQITAGKGDLVPEFEEEVFSLNEGEVSHILENDSGYYIFYCKTKLDEDATDQKKEDIILARQNEIFMEAYERWCSEAEIIVNYELWDSIHF